MSQQPQSSSNETNFSFAPAVPAQAISDTPGSARRAGAAVRSRTERLEVEHLQIASRCSVLLVPIEEVPKDRRQQGRIALEDPLLLLSKTQVAMVRRTRPRVRMRRVGLPPHPSASRLVVLRGMRAKHDYDVNYNTAMKSWNEVNKQGLNLKID
jgi:hypothetical protein